MNDVTVEKTIIKMNKMNNSNGHDEPDINS